MLIFESTKTNTPIAQQDLTPILISPPHTYVHNHSNDDRENKWRWHTSIFKQKPTWISCETKQNQRYSSIKKTQSNLGIWFEPFPLLESNSDIYAGPASYLIATLLYNFLFLWFFHHRRHAPLLLIGYKCVLGLCLILWSKAFFKYCLVHLYIFCFGLPKRFRFNYRFIQITYHIKQLDGEMPSRLVYYDLFLSIFYYYESLDH